MDKKKIMKKHCGAGAGKGGMISDAYNNVKDTVLRTGAKVKSAITNGIVKFVGDTPAGKMLKDGLDNQKAQSLKNAIKKSTVAPTKVTTKALEVMNKIPTSAADKKDKIAEWEKKHPIKYTSNGVGVGY